MEYMKKKGAYDNKGKESNKIRQLKKPSYTNQKEWIKVLIVGGEFPKKNRRKPTTIHIANQNKTKEDVKLH